MTSANKQHTLESMSKKVCLPGDIMIEGEENVTCSCSSNIVETNLNVLLYFYTSLFRWRPILLLSLGS